MTEIINEPKIQNPLIVKFRELLNHRAFWLYLLTDEAEKRGLNPKGFASAAITKCGISQENGLVKKGGAKSLRGLKKRCSPKQQGGSLRWTRGRAIRLRSIFDCNKALWAGRESAFDCPALPILL